MWTTGVFSCILSRAPWQACLCDAVPTRRQGHSRFGVDKPPQRQRWPRKVHLRPAALRPSSGVASLVRSFSTKPSRGRVLQVLPFNSTRWVRATLAHFERDVKVASQKAWRCLPQTIRPVAVCARMRQGILLLVLLPLQVTVPV